MFEPLERFLGIDTLTRKSDVMRTRAVYMMGLAFMATQFINLVTMSYSYGAFTFDHIPWRCGQWFYLRLARDLRLWRNCANWNLVSLVGEFKL